MGGALTVLYGNSKSPHMYKALFLELLSGHVMVIIPKCVLVLFRVCRT